MRQHRVQLLDPLDIERWLGRPCSNKQFQRLRRDYADLHAEGPFYIVADDDCLPGPKPFVARGVAILEAHPEFAILAMPATNQPLGPWTSVPEGYEPYEDDEVVEHHAVGGIRFCRKGHLKEWPPMLSDAPRYDGEHALAIREAGMRVGYFKHPDLAMNHIGAGYSTTLPTR